MNKKMTVVSDMISILDEHSTIIIENKSNKTFTFIPINPFDQLIR